MDLCGSQGGRVYMGWCDGVQAHDCNTARVTRSAPRAETPAAQAGSLGMSQARATEAEDGSPSVRS